MSKSKVRMPKSLEKKCHIAIHSATTAAAAAGAIPLTMSDAIPITVAQITMIISLGKIFDIKLSDSTAKSIASVGLTQVAGRFIVANTLKAIPGPTQLVGSFVSATTAATITEALGWSVADDFYRMSKGEEAENLVEIVKDLKDVFTGLRLFK